jgi:peptidoglycan/LPS O-acetylase OafA/YrhL
MVVLDRRIALALVALAAATAGWPIYLVTVTVALSYGVLVLALATKPIGAAFFRDVDLSYGMLLYGWPLTQFIVAHEPFAPVGSIATLALLATAGMAVLSWRLVEQPAIRFGRFLTAGYDRRADVALRSAQAFRTRP